MSGETMVPLYAIRDPATGYYWTCSSEHGTGWHEGYPKQAFSPSEVSLNLRRVMGLGGRRRVEVVQLSIPT